MKTLDCVGILRKQSRTFMNLKWTCLINGDSYELLWFIRNFQITIDASGMIAAGAKI